MDLVSILTAVGASGLVTAIVGWIQNRRINIAQADATKSSAEANYTQEILKQANERVAQALEDRNRALKERNDAYETAKQQRMDKHEWRNKFFECQADGHGKDLLLKDRDLEIQKLIWLRCDAVCANRVPPREEIRQQFKT